MASIYQANEELEIGARSEETRAGLLPWNAANRREKEQFRRLQISLGLRQREAMIAVCSTTSDEDVSWTTAMLACAMSEQGRPVMIFDANRQNPSLEGLFKIHGTDSGISKSGHDGRPENLPNIQVVHAEKGNSGAKEVIELLLGLKRLGKTILVACEPVLGSSQPLFSAPIFDGALLVVDTEKERRSEVTRAVAEMRRARLPLLGVIVNKS